MQHSSMGHTDQLGLDVHKGITWVAHLSALAIARPQVLQLQVLQLQVLQLLPLLSLQQHLLVA